MFGPVNHTSDVGSPANAGQATLKAKMKKQRVIRVYFVFRDPLDDSGVNLSYVDVKGAKDFPAALQRVRVADESRELWENLYPYQSKEDYRLIPEKMSPIDITDLPDVQDKYTTIEA